MNIQPSDYKNKKYTVKSVKKEDSIEITPRPVEEFAEQFIRSYDHALKVATGKIKGNDDIREQLTRIKKLAEEND